MSFVCGEIQGPLKVLMKLRQHVTDQLQDSVYCMEPFQGKLYYYSNLTYLIYHSFYIQDVKCQIWVTYISQCQYLLHAGAGRAYLNPLKHSSTLTLLYLYAYYMNHYTYYMGHIFNAKLLNCLIGFM